MTDTWDEGPPRSDGQLVVRREPGEDLAYTAYRLQQAGHDWQTIADSVGYQNAKTAEVCVRQYLQKAALEVSADQRREALELELARTGRLINAYWDIALAGEVKAAEFVLKVITLRARLQGLDENAEKTNATTKTIVIAGTPQEYSAALQAFVED